LKDISKKYKPDIVILAIDMTDFHEDIIYLRLLEKKGMYWLVGVIPITCVLFNKVISRVNNSLYKLVFGLPSGEFLITDRPLSETLPYFSHIRKSIENINAFCKTELNVKFT
jgi:hypothetical protein